MAEDLSKVVRLYNDGEKFKSKWDGKSVEIGKGKFIEVPLGLAQHFMKQSDDLHIEEIPVKPVDKREPINPLDEGKRGKAFADLEE